MKPWVAESSAGCGASWQMPTTYVASPDGVSSPAGSVAGAVSSVPASPQAASASTMTSARTMQSSFFIFIIVVSFCLGLCVLCNKKTPLAVQGERRCCQIVQQVSGLVGLP